jgi:putative FmdB family regulatory protein
MPTYAYECAACGLQFERRQGMSEAALVECPECGGNVRRVITGGGGFIVKGMTRGRSGHGGTCALEHAGSTCCGRAERCDEPPCSGAE